MIALYRSSKVSGTSSSKHSSSSKPSKPVKPVEEVTSESEIDEVPAPSQSKSKEHRDKSKSVEKSKDKERSKERVEKHAAVEKPVEAAPASSAPKKPYHATDDEIVDNWEKWDLRGNDARGEESRKKLRAVVERLRLWRKLNPNSEITEVDIYDELKATYQDYMATYPDGPRHHKEKDAEAVKIKKAANAARKSGLHPDGSKKAKILEYPVETLSEKAQEVRSLYLQLQASALQANAFLAQLAVTEKAVQSMLRSIDENDLE